MNSRFFISIAALAVLGSVTSCQSLNPQGMTIHSQDWGTTKNGQNVRLYTLRNSNGMEAKISNYGGIIVSLTAPDKKGQFADVVLGFDKLADYEERNPFFGCITGRYANRIAKGKFTLDGKAYTLATNNGPNHLHGGKEGFDKKVWRASTLYRPNGVGVELFYTSPDGEEGYPGTLNCRVAYLLTSNNSLEIEYTATTDKPTVVNLTNHSYFNLAGEGKGSILDHVATINADAYTPTDDTLIPTGTVESLNGTPLDFSRPRRIGDRIHDDFTPLKQGKGYDHNYVLNGGAGLKTAARVKDPSSGRVLEVLTTEPGVQLYTGNHLNVTGKGGHHYAARHGFCLETQHFPDSPNKSSFPSVILQPGDSYQHTCIFKFTTE
ncbi:MAG: aldose epimerase family protein [Roseimicrobium sp.]